MDSEYYMHNNVKLMHTPFDTTRLIVLPISTTTDCMNPRLFGTKDTTHGTKQEECLCGLT